MTVNQGWLAADMGGEGRRMGEVERGRTSGGSMQVATEGGGGRPGDRKPDWP